MTPYYADCCARKFARRMWHRGLHITARQFHAAFEYAYDLAQYRATARRGLDEICRLIIYKQMRARCGCETLPDFSRTPSEGATNAVQVET